MLRDVKWAATKITVSPSAAVMTSTTRSATEQPKIGQTIRVRAHRRVDSVVKWFNAEKGFGFVAVVGGSEAFIHIRQLEAAGHSSVPEGARIKVRIGQGQKGPEVTEVIEVDLSSARLESSVGRRPATPSQVVGQTKESIGTVKMYRVDKGFGFVGQDDGGKDVFVHATALVRAGLNGLAEGQRVRMKIGQGKKGLEAQAIALLD
jgi:CspA family cold shock protein